MSRPIIRIHNLQTGETVDREMNDDEFAQFQEKKAAAELGAQAQAQAAAAKFALLERLGITEEEAKLLLS